MTMEKNASEITSVFERAADFIVEEFRKEIAPRPFDDDEIFLGWDGLNEKFHLAGARIDGAMLMASCMAGAVGQDCFNRVNPDLIRLGSKAKNHMLSHYKVIATKNYKLEEKVSRQKCGQY